MAKKKAVKKKPVKVAPAPAQEVEVDESLILPDGCGPLADYLYEVVEGHRDFNLSEWLGDFQASVEFLENLPADVQVHQIDFLSNVGWSKDAEKKIKRYLSKVIKML